MPSGLPGFDRGLEAVIFDFDGVIVESTAIKVKAFRELFADRPATIEAVVEFHRHNAGIDRLTKFEMIYRDILHETLNAERKAALARRFQDLVEERVGACPMVVGAAALLTALDGHVPMAVVSATPQAEIERIVIRRGLERYFRVVRGSPPDKTRSVHALLAAEGWHAARVLMVGDSAADFAAAHANGLAFIGRLVPDELNPFPPGIPAVRDLAPLVAAAITLYDTPPHEKQTGIR